MQAILGESNAIAREKYGDSLMGAMAKYGCLVGNTAM